MCFNFFLGLFSQWAAVMTTARQKAQSCPGWLNLGSTVPSAIPRALAAELGPVHYNTAIIALADLFLFSIAPIYLLGFAYKKLL